MRNNSIDLMRFIGLAMIIFAHVEPPGVLFQLRNFDVPLMVLVSGMSFGLSYKENEIYTGYIWKRIKRLAFPVWIFLTGYFLVLFLFLPTSSDLNLYKIIGSYLLAGGIGYVWIIRVFILVALVSPFIFKWHMSISSNKRYFGTLTLILVVYEIARYFSLPYIQDNTGEAISLISHYIIPYSIIFAIGLRLPSLEDKHASFLSLTSLVIFVSLGTWIYATTGMAAPTQHYKYPPSIYYLSYALFVSSFLWIFRRQFEFILEKTKSKEFVLFCAQNSIWIYLWHIPFVKFFHSHFIVKYIVVFSISVLLTFIQVWIINKVMNQIQSVIIKKNIKVLFTG